jgi:hypothetical protein
VAIATELALRGAVAQYGRGVVADVAGRLTDQFARCIAAKLADAAEEHEPAPDEPQAPPAPVGGLRLMFGALWSAAFRRSRR